MCSGSLIIAALGFLTGQRATTYPTSVELLQSYDVEVVQEPLVTVGNISTAAGCLAALDLVSWIIDTKSSVATRRSVMASVQPVGLGLASLV